MRERITQVEPYQHGVLGENPPGLAETQQATSVQMYSRNVACSVSARGMVLGLLCCLDYAAMTAQPSSIRSLFLAGPAGRLEALLNMGAESATHAAVVCHPHPLYGGTLHNKVVFHAMKALNSFGYPVLRFNFRGTGLSEGEHSNGIGEVEDVRAALDWLEREFNLPIIFAGFSFGAAVGLRAAYADDRIPAVIGVGIPAIP